MAGHVDDGWLLENNGLQMEKVFVIGFHKTGTTSLTKALEILGYRVAGPNLELLQPLKSGNYDPVFAIMDKHDACQDDPWFLLYQELDDRYPNSKFILTVRDTESWLGSMRKHHIESPMRRWIYDVDGASMTDKVFRPKYVSHNHKVISYFDGRPNDLMLMDLTNGDGWGKLCSFLGKPVPKTFLTRRPIPFPHANKYTARQRRFGFSKSKRKLKQIIRDWAGREALQRCLRMKDWLLYRFKI